MRIRMPRPYQQLEPEDLLGSLEARVMRVMWEHGEAKVQEVLDRLNEAGRRHLAYNTVMTVMARLAQEKGLLVRRRKGRAFVYAPSMTQDQWAHDQAAHAAEEMLRDYGAAAIAGFLDTVRDRPDMRAELERMLEGPSVGTVE